MPLQSSEASARRRGQGVRISLVLESGEIGPLEVLLYDQFGNALDRRFADPDDEKHVTIGTMQRPVEDGFDSAYVMSFSVPDWSDRSVIEIHNGGLEAGRNSLLARSLVGARQRLVLPTLAVADRTRAVGRAHSSIVDTTPLGEQLDDLATLLGSQILQPFRHPRFAALFGEQPVKDLLGRPVGDTTLEGELIRRRLLVDTRPSGVRFVAETISPEMLAMAVDLLTAAAFRTPAAARTNSGANEYRNRYAARLQTIGLATLMASTSRTLTEEQRAFVREQARDHVTLFDQRGSVAPSTPGIVRAARSRETRTSAPAVARTVDLYVPAIAGSEAPILEFVDENDGRVAEPIPLTYSRKHLSAQRLVGVSGIVPMQRAGFHLHVPDGARRLVVHFQDGFDESRELAAEEESISLGGQQVRSIHTTAMQNLPDTLSAFRRLFLDAAQRAGERLQHQSASESGARIEHLAAIHDRAAATGTAISTGDRRLEWELMRADLRDAGLLEGMDFTDAAQLATDAAMAAYFVNNPPRSSFDWQSYLLTATEAYVTERLAVDAERFDLQDSYGADEPAFREVEL